MKLSPFIKKLLPVLVLVLAGLSWFLITNNPPTQARGAPPKVARINVDIEPIEVKPFSIDVASYGVVRPRTQSTLSSQVSGQILSVSDNFREGGFFDKGEVLVLIDDRDLKATVQSASAALELAKQALIEEMARGEQAVEDWKRLGGNEEPNALVLRQPQLATAKADVAAAEANLATAKLNLERAQVIAPYQGRIREQFVDIGQVVSNSSELASIFATDLVEVRLPIKNSDLQFINLPEQYANGQSNLGAKVVFSSNLFESQRWHGKLVRTESAIDENAQQLYVVAQIADPYGADYMDQQSIKIGQYVKASIQGKTISDAIVIPNSTIYQGTYVYIENDGFLQRKDIKVAWQSSDESIISSGLSSGDNLVLTPLGQVSSGTPVTVNQSFQRVKDSATTSSNTTQGAVK
ncbi:efflux RND transporter periplasmic adaptor subunit [Glaciecola sp. 1036]|uniref:efflux RND transporter periplasmic adaptor subunit n=1 Tax=Alteromonadaceae TaxID=72275 RepID=UPI003CFE645B